MPDVTQIDPVAEPGTRDEHLIAAVAHGDRHAFETIYDRYAPAVFGLALKILRDPAAAEEAVQETFWRVWQRAGSFDCSRPFLSWLFAIAHHYCIDELRRRRARPHLVYEDLDHPLISMIPDATDMGETVLRAEQRRLLAEALQQVPPKERQALELAYFGGLTHREIADHLGNPLGTIKTRLRVGLQRLRAIVSRQGLTEEGC